MKFLTISKFLMILILPFLIFLFSFSLYAFNLNFYREKFSEYGVYSSIPQADALNLKVINFITGKNNDIPNEFNSRERQHLMDVRKAIGVSKTIFYFSIVLFVSLLIISALILNKKNNIIKFVSIVLISGGFLTIALAGTLFLMVHFDFSSAFESFHKLLFDAGTYTFDPSKEIIVRLYPEQIFMDIGSIILRTALILSAVSISLGILLSFNSKNKKNKNRKEIRIAE